MVQQPELFALLPVKQSELAKLEKQDHATDLLESLHNPRNSMRMTKFLVNWRRRLTNTDLDVQLLSKYDNICYLLDFDVVRAFIDSDAPSPEKWFQDIRFVLGSSDVDFALPWGAYLELIDYLEGLLGNQALLLGNDFQEYLSPNEIEQIIGSVIRTSMAREGEQSLRDTFDKLSRLLELFSMGRFRGVIGKYDRDEKDKLRSIISALPRFTSDTQREKRDERDAINIAITLPSLREALNRLSHTGQSKYIAGYLLISDTKLVSMLPARATEIEDKRIKTHAIGVLCELLEAKRSDFIFEEEGSYIWSAFSLERISRVERLGGATNRHKVDSTIEKLLEPLRTISDYVKDWDHLLQKTGHSDSLSKFEENHREEMLTAIRAILSTTSHGRDQVAYDFFLSEDTSASVEYMMSDSYLRSEQVDNGAEVVTAEDINYNNLLQIISSIIIKLETDELVSYHTEVGAKIEDITFDDFTIIQRIDPDINTTILYGERYGENDKFSYYSIWWPTSEVDSKFLDSMKRLIRQSTRRPFSEPTELKFTKIDDSNHQFWRQGLVLVTEDGCLGCSLEGVINNWRKLRMHLMGSKPSEVSQIWINTQFGKFIFDRIPEDGENFRYVSILSHVNLANEIALTYYNTGVIKALPSQLSREINKKLRTFPSRTFSKVSR